MNTLDEIYPSFLSLDELSLLMAPWKASISKISKSSFNDRLMLLIEYFEYIDNLVKRKILYVPYAASFVLDGLGLIRNSGQDNIDKMAKEIWEVMVDLEIPNLMSHFTPRDRPLSDWKIIEDFIEKYKSKT